MYKSENWNFVCGLECKLIIYLKKILGCEFYKV